MNAWPAIKTILYDGWIIRLADGYSNRANSVNPLYASKIEQEEKIRYCERLFSAYNLPACYKLVSCEEHTALDKRLEALAYGKINETSIQTREISPFLEADYRGIVVSGDFSESWVSSVIAYNRIGARSSSAFRKIIGNIAGKKIVVYKEVDGKIVGCGYGTIGRGYVGVFDIVVGEKYRRKGYGGEIVKTILSRAAGQGVKKTYLQVMLNNPAALGLYEKLGYREQYRYWYRKKLFEA